MDGIPRCSLLALLIVVLTACGDAPSDADAPVPAPRELADAYFAEAVTSPPAYVPTYELQHTPAFPGTVFGRTEEALVMRLRHELGAAPSPRYQRDRYFAWPAEPPHPLRTATGMLRAASILEQVEDWKVIEQDLDTEWTEPGTVTQPEPTQPGTGGWCGTPIRYPPTRQRVEDWRRVELESHRPRLNWGETTYERGVFSRAWRVGWMVVPDDHVRVVERLAQNMFICAPHASQVAALAAMDAQEELQANLEVYKRNRQLMLDGLPAAGFDHIAPPDGAFYVYADVSAHTNDSRAFAAEILEKAGVAVTPGLDFDPVRGHQTLRFSYARSSEDIAEGLERLKTFMASR